MTQRLAVALVAVLSSTALAQSYAQPVIATGGECRREPSSPRNTRSMAVSAWCSAARTSAMRTVSRSASPGGARLSDRRRHAARHVRLLPRRRWLRRSEAAPRSRVAIRCSRALLVREPRRGLTGRFDFWGELGAGYEHVDWMHGGVLDRPSLELALGFDFGGRGDRDRDGRRARRLLHGVPHVPRGSARATRCDGHLWWPV